MEAIANFIDGQMCAPLNGLYLDNHNPLNGEVYCRLPDSTAEDIELAVAAASAAFPSWKALKRQERAAILMRLAALIEERAEAFAEAESRDQGKPIELARKVDIPRAVENFRFFAGAILHQKESAFQTSAEIVNYTIRQPLGVAGLISPWNLPLYLLTWKLAPALASGNTVVAKPSELTPMTAFMLAGLFEKAGLPPGVCNIVFGRGISAGGALVSHPKVPLISFTGGTKTAAHIGSRAAPYYKKLSFELGGKNPAVIFADCDFEATVKGVVRSAFLNQGEICLATSRVLVEETLVHRFTEAFLAAVESLKLGDPREADTFMGPLVSLDHLQKVEGFVARALANREARLLSGGRRMSGEGELKNGYFFQPTVLLVDDPAAEIMQEEVFGPVVTISAFKNYEHAIRLANQTRYGLATSIWTQNLSTAHRAAQDIEAAQVWVNTWMNRDLRVPFGGMKASGLGREGGSYSLEFYTEEKNICLQL